MLSLASTQDEKVGKILLLSLTLTGLSLLSIPQITPAELFFFCQVTWVRCWQTERRCKMDTKLLPQETINQIHDAESGVIVHVIATDTLPVDFSKPWMGAFCRFLVFVFMLRWP